VQRTLVRSKSIRSLGYDPEDHVLEVEFVNGRVYHYLNVPEAVHRLALRAPSIGAFVNTQVIPRFDWRRT
jgi:hypothetical protein